MKCIANCKRLSPVERNSATQTPRVRTLEVRHGIYNPQLGKSSRCPLPNRVMPAVQKTDDCGAYAGIAQGFQDLDCMELTKSVEGRQRTSERFDNDRAKLLEFPLRLHRCVSVDVAQLPNKRVNLLTTSARR